MVPLRVEQYVVGSVSTNCYFAINDDTKEVLIIDPGASAKKLAEKVREGGLKPTAILLTHGHFDHAGAAEELAGLLDVKIYVKLRNIKMRPHQRSRLFFWYHAAK